MSSTKKGNDWYFGMKAHVGVDVDGGTVHSLEATTAKVHDSRVWDELLHGEEKSVWADKGYVSAEREAAFSKEGKVWGVMRKAPKGGQLDPIDEKINRIIAKVRAKVEHHQAPVRSYEDAVSRAGQEPGASVHAVCARQPVPSATTAAGVRMSPSEIATSAAQAGKTVQKLLKTGRQKARTTLKPVHPRSWSRLSDVP